MPEINDDTFDYTNGFKQCISGFGRSAIDVIRETVEAAHAGQDQDPEAMERIEWHVNELVRWCRGLNGELKRQAAVVEKLPRTADGVPVAPGDTVFYDWGISSSVEYRLAGYEWNGEFWTVHFAGGGFSTGWKWTQTYSNREAAEAARAKQIN